MSEGSNMNLEDKLKRLDKNPLQKFKFQNKILKKYGQKGIKVFKKITDGIKISDLLEKTKVDENFLTDLLTWMKEESMIEIISSKDIAPKKQKKIKKKLAEKLVESQDKKEIEEIEPEFEGEEKVEDEEIGSLDEGVKEEESSDEIGGEVEAITPSEKVILNKYGKKGLEVYRLIDGNRSADEIVKETGVSEGKLIEMLEWMEKQGIIKLQHPTRKEKEEVGEKDLFSPLVGEKVEDKVIIDKNPIQVPIWLKKDILSTLKSKITILLKFGTRGLSVLDEINNEKSDVDIASKLKLPLGYVRKIIDALLKIKVIKIDELNREEIKKRFGVDAYIIYKKYGSNGVLLYELIDKNISINQMYKLTMGDKDLFIDMFLFIHKILGVEIPIDREILYKKLSNSG